MPEPDAKPQKLSPSAKQMIRKIGLRQSRVERERGSAKSIWSSVAILGMIGWSVVVPTLVGVALGSWIDHRRPSRFSWTVALMLLGLILGCTHAWTRIKGDR